MNGLQDMFSGFEAAAAEERENTAILNSVGESFGEALAIAVLEGEDNSDAGEKELKEELKSTEIPDEDEPSDAEQKLDDAAKEAMMQFELENDLELPGTEEEAEELIQSTECGDTQCCDGNDPNCPVCGDGADDDDEGLEDPDLLGDDYDPEIDPDLDVEDECGTNC